MFTRRTLFDTKDIAILGNCKFLCLLFINQIVSMFPYYLINRALGDVIRRSFFEIVKM